MSATVLAISPSSTPPAQRDLFDVDPADDDSDAFDCICTHGPVPAPPIPLRPPGGGAGAAGRAGAGRPESAVPAAPMQPSMETGMNHIAPRAEPLIREVPLSRLALAPENVRKTPPDQQADAELKASIAAIGLLENLVC